MTADRYPGKLLALDVGQARIGVATCDPLGLTVRPLTVIRRRGRQQDFTALARIAATEGAEGLVCGLPLNMDGSEGSQARIVRRWARRLAHALVDLLGGGLPILFWDERLSTYVAQEQLARGHVRAGEDAAAAAVILRAYLDARAAGAQTDFGRIEAPDSSPPQASTGTHGHEWPGK